MKRVVLRAGLLNARANDLVEVGDGYETWNKAIGATCGEIVKCRNGHQELWVNENGLAEECELNQQASFLTGLPIVGDAILFEKGDIT